MSSGINGQRAEWARVGVQAFANKTRGSRTDRDLSNQYVMEEAVSDLLCDLLHLLGAERFERCIHRGRTSYRIEIAEDAE